MGPSLLLPRQNISSTPFDFTVDTHNNRRTDTLLWPSTISSTNTDWPFYHHKSRPRSTVVDARWPRVTGSASRGRCVPRDGDQQTGTVGCYTRLLFTSPHHPQDTTLLVSSNGNSPYCDGNIEQAISTNLLETDQPWMMSKHSARLDSTGPKHNRKYSPPTPPLLFSKNQIEILQYIYIYQIVDDYFF